jgi:hypothetical protein
MSIDPTSRGGGGKLRLPLTDDHSWNVPEAAYYLGVSEGTVRNLERDEELPALPRIRGRVTFDPKIVKAYRDGWRPPPGWRRQAPPPPFTPNGEAPPSSR